MLSVTALSKMEASRFYRYFVKTPNYWENASEIIEEYFISLLRRIDCHVALP
jgi:hypothetical protein